MGIRSTLASFLASPASNAMEPDIRRVVEEALAARPTPTADTSALEDRVAKLEKKLNMAMGAVQAATAQIMSLKKDLEEVHSAANQASQHATTARNTAEAAADGVTGAEEQIAALMKNLGELQAVASAPSPAKKAPAKAKKAPAKATKAPAKKARKAAPEHCTVDGCDGKHRARGYCAKHYQQWKRGTL